MSNITAITTVMVPVSDVDAAVAFYTDKLGFEKRFDIPFGDGDRWVTVGPRGGEAEFSLAPPREGFEPGRNLGVALSSSDLEADHAALREGGVDVDPEIAKMGGPVPDMFWFRDGDGNTHLLVQQPAT